MPIPSQYLAGLGAAPVLPGEVLAGKYRVERVLGAGGWGIVLAARNLQLGQRVAIKLLARETAPDTRARMLREAQAAARIHSDHVVQVHDVGTTESDTPYIVMEYLEGQDLACLLKQSGPVSVPLAVHWTLQACEGLAAAQQHGIVHRDLKPANLFLERRPDGSGRLKLLDFGIAKLPDATGITEAGGFMGSPAYMAPEQLLDARDVDGRTDVWSLGVVLYELLTAQRPFSAEAPLALITSIREQQHRPLRSLASDVPEGLSQIVNRCLAKSREARWQAVAPLARALAPFAPPQAQELVLAIERLGRGHNPQLTLGSEAPARPPQAAPPRADSPVDSDGEPAGLAATLAGPLVLRSRLLLAGLLLMATAALAFGVLRGQTAVTKAPAKSLPAAGAAALSVSTQASTPAAAPELSEPAPPPSSPAAEPALRAATLAQSSAPAPPRAPRKRSAAASLPPPPPSKGPPGGETSTPPAGGPVHERPAGGPLPINRRGPWD